MADPYLKGEFSLIEKLFSPLSESAKGAYGLKNDGALLTPPNGKDLVITKDLMVSGVHYRFDEDPSIVSRRLLRVNLSDLASMGATASSYALGLALPRDTSERWLEDFVHGLKQDQKEFGVTLIGGDTVATEGPTVLSLTAFGVVSKNSAHTRGGACLGDDVYVSGTIGDGTLGLLVTNGELNQLNEPCRRELATRFRLPVPRLALGQALQGIATCVIDVSDGLMADLDHICRASGLACFLCDRAVPLSASAESLTASSDIKIATLLTGGDDYELLFCAAPSQRTSIERVSRLLDLQLTRIGAISKGCGAILVDGTGHRINLETSGYQHF